MELHLSKVTGGNGGRQPREGRHGSDFETS